MFYRSAYHLDLIDYIFDQISKGNNFSQISESVADLHLADYLRHGGCEDEFYTEELTRYPSHENVSSFHLILIWGVLFFLKLTWFPLGYDPPKR